MKVWNAPITTEFDERWSSFITKWKSIHPYGERVVKYFNDTRLPYADQFVNCYIHQYPQLGHLASSKAEGAHHYLKMVIAE